MTKRTNVVEAGEGEGINLKEKAVKNDKNSVLVSFQGKKREYSKELHGKDFLKLAQEFADKHNGELA